MVEPAQKRLPNKVVITNVPASTPYNEIEKLATRFGKLWKLDHGRRGEAPSFFLTYQDPQAAKEASEGLNGEVVGGAPIRAELLPVSNFGGPGRRNFRSRSNDDYPLRILVPSDLVGAIIGRKGECIKEITQRSRARVDVTRQDTPGLNEKMISIFGTNENCIAACREIMQVLLKEADSGGKEIELRILAHNAHCGRLIGKNGIVIKKVMEDSNTKIAVASLTDIPGYLNIYRAVAIRGSLDGMIMAATAVHEKLKQCQEKDEMRNRYNGGYPAMMPPVGMAMGMGGFGAHYGPPMHAPMGPSFMHPTNVFSGAPAPQAAGHRAAADVETAYLYVPSSSVGALIGTKGHNIKMIMEYSKARVKIETKELEDDQLKVPAANRPSKDLRQVVISGTPESQWKAQYYIFDKMRNKSYGQDNISLLCEIVVPKALVGRIIGKSGQTVLELQSTSGAKITLPEKPVQQNAEDVRVQIEGNFFASQMAQRRIRAIVDQAAGGAGRAPHAGLHHDGDERAAASAVNNHDE